MHSDHSTYFNFTGKARLERSINSLIGIVDGITADSKINETEVRFLNNWLDENRVFANRHPYNELIPLVACALRDGLLTCEELADIQWLCERLRSDEYFDNVTADIQRLHGMVGAIASDGWIEEAELRGLSE